MQFVLAFVKALDDGAASTAGLVTAYTSTLSHHHSVIVRSIFLSAFRVAPSRDAILKRLGSLDEYRASSALIEEVMRRCETLIAVDLRGVVVAAKRPS